MAVTEYWNRIKALFTEPVVSDAQIVVQRAPWSIGKIAAGFQREFVKTAAGERIDTQLTPAMLLLPVQELGFMSDYLDVQATEQVSDPNVWPGPTSRDVMAWKERLAHYEAVIERCFTEDRHDDPTCIYDDVVSPLLLGYYPDGQGGFSDRKPSDITFIYRWMNALTIDAETKTELGPWSLFGLFWEATLAKIPEIGSIMKDAAVGTIEHVYDQMQWQRKILPYVLVAATVLGLVYLSVRYNPPRRTP